MIEDMPVIPIYFYTNLSIRKDSVQNMAPEALGNLVLKNVVIGE